MRLIDADNLVALCNMVADGADGMGKSIWKQFSTTVEWCPTVEAIPIEWIKKYEKYDDLSASIYRMLEAWGADLSDYEEWEKVNK